MANNVNINITATNQTQAAVTQIKQGVQSIGNSFGELRGGISAASSQVEKLAGIVHSLGQGFVLLGSMNIFRNIAQDAARAESLATVLNVIAKNAGYSQEAIVKVDKSIQRLGITAQDSRQSLSQFIQAGLQVADAAKLARAAQDLAVISGETSSATFQGLTQAIGETSIMMLRFRGIMVTNEEAQEKYAMANGKSVASLEDWEKKQALLNLVLERSQKLVGIYEAAMGDVGKQVSSLERYQTDAATAMGNNLIPAYSNVVLELTNFLRTLKISADASSASGNASKELGEAVGTIASAVGSATTFLIDHKEAVVNVVKAYAGFKVTQGLAAGLAGMRQSLVGQAIPAGQNGQAAKPAGALTRLKDVWGQQGSVTAARVTVAEQTNAAATASASSHNAARAAEAAKAAEAQAARIRLLATQEKINQAAAQGTALSQAQLVPLRAQAAAETAILQEKLQQLATQRAQLVAAGQQAAATAATATANAANTAFIATQGSVGKISQLLSGGVARAFQGILNIGKGLLGLIGGIPGLILGGVIAIAMFTNWFEKLGQIAKKTGLIIKDAFTGGTDTKKYEEQLERKRKQEAREKGKSGSKEVDDAAKEYSAAASEATQAEYQLAQIVEKLKSSSNDEDIAERSRLMQEIIEKKKLAAEKKNKFELLADDKGISKEKREGVTNLADQEAYRGKIETDELKRSQSLLKSREATGQTKQVFSSGIGVSMEASNAFESYRKEFKAYVDGLPGADASMARLVYSTNHFVKSLKSVQDAVVYQTEYRNMVKESASAVADLNTLASGGKFNYKENSKEDINAKRMQKEIEDEAKYTAPTRRTVSLDKKKGETDEAHKARTKAAQDIADKEHEQQIADRKQEVIRERQTAADRAKGALDVTTGSGTKARMGMLGNQGAMLAYYDAKVASGDISAEEDVKIRADEKRMGTVKKDKDGKVEKDKDGKPIIEDSNYNRMKRATEELMKMQKAFGDVTVSAEKFNKEQLALSKADLALQGITEKTHLYAKALEKVSELLEHHEKLRRKTESSGVFKAEGAGASTLEADRMVANAQHDYEVGMKKAALLEKKNKEAANVEYQQGSVQVQTNVAEKEAEAKKLKDRLEAKNDAAGNLTAKGNLEEERQKTSQDQISVSAKEKEKGVLFEEAVLTKRLELLKKNSTEETKVREKDLSDQLSKVKGKADVIREGYEAQAAAEAQAASEMGGVAAPKQRGLTGNEKQLAEDHAGNLNMYQAKVDEDTKLAKTAEVAANAARANIGQAQAQVEGVAQAQISAVSAAANEERLKVTEKYFDAMTAALDKYKDGYLAKMNAIRDIQKGNVDIAATLQQGNISKARTEESLKMTPDAARMGQIDAAEQQTKIGATEDKYKLDVDAQKKALEQKIKMVQDSAVDEQTKAKQIKNLHEADIQERLTKDKDYFTQLNQSRETALQKYQEYANKAKELEKSLRDQAVSYAADVRDVKRIGTGDTAQFKDKQAEMKEYYAEAKRLRDQGDLEQAKKMADKGYGVAKGLASAPGVSITTAKQTALEGMAEGNALSSGIGREDQAKNLSAAEQQKKIYQDMTTAVNQVAEGIKKLGAEGEVKLNPTIDDEAIKNLMQKLATSVKDQDTQIKAILSQDSLTGIVESIQGALDKQAFNIKVNPVEGNGQGNSQATANAEAPAPSTHFAGGLIQAKAEGGIITGPGTGTSDSIPAMLSDGEFVVKEEATSHYGKGFLDLLNSKALRFADGGFVQKFAKGGAPTVSYEEELARQWAEHDAAAAKQKPSKGGRILTAEEAAESNAAADKAAASYPTEKTDISGTIFEKARIETVNREWEANLKNAKAGKASYGIGVYNNDITEAAAALEKKKLALKKAATGGLITNAIRLAGGGVSAADGASNISDYTKKRIEALEGSESAPTPQAAPAAATAAAPTEAAPQKASFDIEAYDAKQAAKAAARKNSMWNKLISKVGLGYEEGGTVEKPKEKEKTFLEQLIAMAAKEKRPIAKGSETASIGIRGATGGLFQRLAEGGIPALVSNGEFRVNPDAVSHYGANILHSINDMAFPKFAEGGVVGAANSVINNENLGGSPAIKDVVEIAFKVNDNVHRLQGSQQSAKDLAKSLRDYSGRNLS